MTSQAFRVMEDRLEEVRILSRSDPIKRDVQSSELTLSRAVNRACVLLLSAHLEGYVEDVTVEALDCLLSLTACVDNLPLLLRSVHAEDHLLALEQVRDRNVRASQIRDLIASEMDLWSKGNRLRVGMLRSRAVCKQMNNPGSREIRKFLELLGIDIRGWLVQTQEQDLLGRTDSLVARRNAIAHGEVSASVTHLDVESFLQTIEALAQAIDAAMADAVMHICQSTSRPW